MREKSRVCLQIVVDTLFGLLYSALPLYISAAVVLASTKVDITMATVPWYGRQSAKVHRP